MKCTSLCGVCPGERNVCCSCTLASYQCHDAVSYGVITVGKVDTDQCHNSVITAVSQRCLCGRVIQTVTERNSCYGHFRKTRLLETNIKWFRLQLLHS